MAVVGRRLRIAMVGNAGGHLVELQALAEAFSGHDVFFVTQRYPWTAHLTDTELLPAQKETQAARIGLLDRWWYRLKLFACIGWLWLKRRPDCIVSSGAEVAIPAFWLGKLIGARTVYVECYTRVYKLSRSARAVMPVTDAFFAQNQPLVEADPKRIRFEGCVL